MTYDHLISEIVEQVLSRMKDTTHISITPSSPPPKQEIVIIGNMNLPQVEALNVQYQLVSLASASKDYTSILITELSTNLLSHLALGLPSTREAHVILESLLNGKKVYVLGDGIGYHLYKESAPRNLYNLYLQYEERLLQYGIQIVKDTHVLLENDSPRKNRDDQFIKPDGKVLSFIGKKLLHESDLTRAYLQGHSVILVDAKTIITPLAVDFIKSHHLKVIYERAEDGDWK